MVRLVVRGKEGIIGTDENANGGKLVKRRKDSVEIMRTERFRKLAMVFLKKALLQWD